MSVSSRVRRIVLPMWTVLAIVSCSGSPAATTTSAPQSVDLVVTMSEWRFAPENGEIPAGAPAVVELRNTGEVVHEWAVVDGHVETEADLTDVQILARLAVNAGGVGRLDLPALDPGVYEVVCPIPGHIASGMVGSLTVGG